MRLSKPCLLFVIIVFTSGCGHKGLYSKGYYSGEAGQRPNAIHTVKPGETLYSIAFQYGQDYRNIARWNNIDKDYTIYPKQALRVSKPALYKRKRMASVTKINNSSRRQQSKTHHHSAPGKPLIKTRNSSHKLNWMWPSKGPILNRFSAKDPGQKGISIAGKKGSPIYAAEAGYVVYSGSGLRGYGKLIIVKHNETFLSAYAHNSRLRAREGEKVKKGGHIADMGNTGSKKVKLHFEIRHNGTPVDPFKYLPKP